MKRLALATTLSIAGAIALAPAATGTPGAEGSATPTKPRLSLASDSGLKDGRSRYVLKGQAVRIAGVLRPYVKGETVVVKVYRGGKQVVRKDVHLSERKDGSGEFVIGFRPAKAGPHSVVAEHVASNSLGAVKSAKYRLMAIKTPRVGGGAHGLRVRLLQAGLSEIGAGQVHGGGFDRTTGYSVAAFRNLHGMGRDGFASKKVFEMLFRHRGAYKLRYPTPARTASTRVRQVAPDARARARRQARATDLHLFRHALDADRVRQLPLLSEDSGHQREGHGPLELLRRRLRDPRLRVRPDLSGEPRLHPDPGPDCARGLQLDRYRRSDVHSTDRLASLPAWTRGRDLWPSCASTRW